MQAITSLSSLLGPISKVASVGSSAYGLYNAYQQQQYQNKLRSLSQNPAKMAQFAAGFTKPLNAGLEANVGNEAQAYLAQRGLSDSPEISQQVESQAIAPYIQQNQQAGYQDALAALGLGGGAIPPGQQMSTSVDQLAKILAGAPPSTSSYAANLPLTMGTQPPIIDQSNPVAPPPIDMADWFNSNFSLPAMGGS